MSTSCVLESEKRTHRRNTFGCIYSQNGSRRKKLAAYTFISSIGGSGVYVG